MIIRIPLLSSNKAPASQAHGRLDVLATVGGICMCLLVGMTAWSKPVASTGAVRCLDNLRRLTMAWSLFSDDHEGNLLSAGSTAPMPGRFDWFAGNDPAPVEGVNWMILPRSQLGSLNPALGLAYSPLMPYLEIGNGKDSVHATFSCPSDPSRGSHPDYRGGKSSPRLRSYSVNNWVNGTAWDNGNPRWNHFRHRSQMVRPSPSNLLVFLGERADSINDTQFFISMRGYEPGKPASVDTRIIDYPACYHDSSGSVSFADGHVEKKQWEDPRTIPAYNHDTLLNLNVPSPGNPDVAWLQAHASAKEY